MSTAPEEPAGGVKSAGVASERLQSCWSCRLTSGGGLLLSAAYVFGTTQRLPISGVVSIGMLTQMAFAVCLASFGVAIIANPVQKKDLKST